jgi:hypothetical protein
MEFEINELKKKLVQTELIIGDVMAGAIEVHREKGSGLLESIYEKWHPSFNFKGGFQQKNPKISMISL